MRAVEVLAVVGIGAGLVLLAVTAGSQQPTDGGFWPLAVVAAVAEVAADVLRIGRDSGAGFWLAALAVVVSRCWPSVHGWYPASHPAS